MNPSRPLATHPSSLPGWGPSNRTDPGDGAAGAATVVHGALDTDACPLTELGSRASEGAGLGGAIGVTTGAIAAAVAAAGSASALPGLDLAMAGPLAAAIAGAGVGATAGAILGAVIGWGIPEERTKPMHPLRHGDRPGRRTPGRRAHG